MGLEDDFLKNDLDDEKTIEYIKKRSSLTTSSIIFSI